MILKLSFKDERKHLPIYVVCERNFTSKLNAVPNQPRNDVLSAAEDLSQAQCRQKTQGILKISKIKFDFISNVLFVG